MSPGKVSPRSVCGLSPGHIFKNKLRGQMSNLCLTPGVIYNSAGGWSPLPRVSSSPPSPLQPFSEPGRKAGPEPFAEEIQGPLEDDIDALLEKELSGGKPNKGGNKGATEETATSADILLKEGKGQLKSQFRDLAEQHARIQHDIGRLFMHEQIALRYSSTLPPESEPTSARAAHIRQVPEIPPSAEVES